MRTLVIIAILISFFGITNAVAGQGCDTLNTYLYNQSSNMLTIQINNIKGGIKDDMNKVPIGSGIVAFLGTADRTHKVFLSMSNYVTSFVKIFANNTPLAYLAVRKYGSQDGTLIIPTPAPDFKFRDDPNSEFSIHSYFNAGSCEQGIPGFWFIVVQNKPPTSLIPSLIKQATPV